MIRAVVKTPYNGVIEGLHGVLVQGLLGGTEGFLTMAHATTRIALVYPGVEEPPQSPTRACLVGGSVHLHRKHPGGVHARDLALCPSQRPQYPVVKEDT